MAEICPSDGLAVSLLDVTLSLPDVLGRRYAVSVCCDVMCCAVLSHAVLCYDVLVEVCPCDGLAILLLDVTQLLPDAFGHRYAVMLLMCAVDVCCDALCRVS